MVKGTLLVRKSNYNRQRARLILHSRSNHLDLRLVRIRPSRTHEQVLEGATSVAEAKMMVRTVDLSASKPIR